MRSDGNRIDDADRSSRTAYHAVEQERLIRSCGYAADPFPMHIGRDNAQQRWRIRKGTATVRSVALEPSNPATEMNR